MRFSTSVARVATAAAILFTTNVHALQKVTRAGRYLYTDDGNRFYIKGIAYQPQGITSNDPNNPFPEPSSFTDPLADSAGCARDIPFLKQLSVNAIRVYSVNSSLNHDSCMQALSAAGIYTILDLSIPLNGSIDRSNPAWTTNLLDLYLTTIDVFSKYDNILAYNIGNEVIVNSNGTVAAPYIKAAARDVKAYLTSKNLQGLVGYAAIDQSADLLVPLANYLSCDSNTDSIDLFGLNNYEWRGDSTFEASYAGVEGAFAGYNVAAYFSEFGSVTKPPRLWTEVQALFSDQMSPVWSGGLAFSYFPAESGDGEFGMVTISGNTVTPNADFTRLVAQYGKVSAPTTPSKSDAGAGTYPSCPAANSTWLASTTLPPTPDDTACACAVSNLSCQFTPQTTNTTAIVGQLIDAACSSLGGAGGNCNDIGGSGSAGTYGRFSYCDPNSKLSFIMTEFYEITNRNAQSCNFAGNATVNKNAPSSVSAVNAAVAQCLSKSQATHTPSAPSTPAATGGSSGGGGGGSPSTPKSSSAALGRAGFEGALGIGAMLVACVVGGMWTLV
ncbi:glycoside hydrolase family 72 protein [Rickenella mellea]|uniref:1,3-beta-glucanosyltransferase n=1 Tax=Rickenella mellea TaxID=50990 RepID=A0A4Y7PMT2_9AGAM|nr:glycoside hydrolase family 72 protein [Rickenella mellea]